MTLPQQLGGWARGEEQQVGFPVGPQFNQLNQINQIKHFPARGIIGLFHPGSTWFCPPLFILTFFSAGSHKKTEMIFNLVSVEQRLPAGALPVSASRGQQRSARAPVGFKLKWRMEG